MNIKLHLTQQGNENLIKKSLTLLQQQKQLTLKQSTQIKQQFKFNDVDTTQNTPIQKSEQEYLSIQQNFKKFYFKISQKKDQHRHPLAHKDGGMMCDDPKQIDKLRSVGKQMIKIIGRKILDGQFNLTKISIPLKSCYPKTALFNSVKGYAIFPHFMSAAAQQKDPLQRFKIVLSSLIAQPYYINMFLKPLNPILGETLQAKLADGSQVYAQQISHHPPISYFLIIGPNQSYKFYGYFDIEVKPGLNSLTIKNKGKRMFSFKDGTLIQTTSPTNQFNNTFFGTSRIQEVDDFVIQDKSNKIKCKITFGQVKKKPSDYFQSKIYQDDKPVANIYGTCVGFLDIDGKRYWDGRQFQNLQIQFIPKESRLPSDWENRSDLLALENNDLQNGQKFKQQLEEIQRKDAKLRKKYKKTQQQNKKNQ